MVNRLRWALAVLATAALAYGLFGWLHGTDTPKLAPAEHATGEGHAGEGGPAAEEFPRGTHNGRLLTDGDFAIEVTIFETGVPPQFRFYATSGGKPVAPQQVQATCELTCLGGRVDRFAFGPEADYLAGVGVVQEPHSFSVLVIASYQGKEHRWRYDSFEGRTTISPEAAKAGGIVVRQVGPGQIREEVTLYGSVVLNPNRTAQVRARFPGIIRSVRAPLGGSVRAGETLAIVEANDSLQSYAVRSPISGVVISRAANPGDMAGDAPLFIVSDLANLLAEFHVFQRDLAKVKVDDPAMITDASGSMRASGRIASFLPVAEPSSQTMVARVALDNRAGQWRAGMSVTGRVTVREQQVALVISNNAIQSFRDSPVVFAKVGDIYEVRMLETGVSDGECTEVTGGVEAGESYVSEGSFLIKADIEKSGASHDH